MGPAFFMVELPEGWPLPLRPLPDGESSSEPENPMRTATRQHRVDATAMADPAGDGMSAGMQSSVRHDGRLDDIARAAYFRAQARGFMPGHELDDWLAAEADYERANGRASR